MSEASVARIAEACLEAPLLERPWDHIVQAIGCEVPELVVLISLAPGWKQGAPTFAAGLDLADFPIPDSDDFPRNPWSEISTLYPEGRFGHGFDTFTPAELKQSAFYFERMRPENLGPDVVYGGFPVLRDGVDELLISMIGPAGFTEWDSAHQTLGARIMPLLRQTFLLQEKLANRVQPSSRVPSWQSEVLDRIRVGALVVDAAGRVLEHNRAADALLRRGDALRCRSGRLRLSTDFETELLHDRIARAASDVTVLGVVIGLHRSDGFRVGQLIVTPMVRVEASAKRALAWIVPFDLPTHDTSALLRESFGLTRAEAALTVELAAANTRARTPVLR